MTSFIVKQLLGIHYILLSQCTWLHNYQVYIHTCMYIRTLSGVHMYVHVHYQVYIHMYAHTMMHTLYSCCGLLTLMTGCSKFPLWHCQALHIYVHMYVVSDVLQVHAYTYIYMRISPKFHLMRVYSTYINVLSYVCI